MNAKREAMIVTKMRIVQTQLVGLALNPLT